MIKRLNVKKNVRLLGVQWDGANISECVSFCRYCHFSDGWMFIMLKEFTVINNETYQYLFDKPKDVENSGE